VIKYYITEVMREGIDELAAARLINGVGVPELEKWIIVAV
jgi:hypothetical protein